MYSYGSARSGKSMIRFFFKNHPKFSNQFVSRNGKLGVTLGRTDTFQNDNEFSSLFFLFQKLSMLAARLGKWSRKIQSCSFPVEKFVVVFHQQDECGFFLVQFFSFAAPSLVLKLDFNTCE